MLKSINPYNNELIGTFEQANLKTLDEVLNKAQLGFTTWRKTSFGERAEFLKSLAATLRNNRDEYAGVISSEMGKVISDSRKEVEKSAMVLEYFAEHGEEHLKIRKDRSDGTQGYTLYQPLGVVLAIMPWNYPFWQFFRFAATTLMAGNTIILKHSSQVPACSKKIEETFDLSCFPGGVFQNIIVDSEKIENIIKDYRIQGVSLTGSVAAGTKVAQQAGRQIKKTVLELGGSDPFIVLEDANVKKAAKAGVDSRMKNFGQSCDAAKRFILHKDIAEEFLVHFKQEMEELRFGDPLDELSDFACLASEGQKKKLKSQVKESLKQGAELYWQDNQHKGDKALFNPVILTNIKFGMPAYSEELFGPAASMFIVDDGLEAVRIANDTEFGLGASIWTNDLERGTKMAPEIQAGILYINDEVHSRPELPFGGIKKSGIGREMAGTGSREFTNKKSIWYPAN